MDLSTVQAINLAPFPNEMMTPCFKCGGRVRREITRHSNRNGNAGRPYDKCQNPRCGKFLGFVDERGNDPTNPECECGVPSKRQITGERNRTPRAIFYVCNRRRCDYYAEETDARGNRVRVQPGLVDLMAMLSII